jgi:hypothetical protein
MAPPRTRNAVAAERTLKALADGGKLEHADAATVALLRHLAGALDRVDPECQPAQVASLARVHLAVIRSLRGMADEPDDGMADLLAALSGPLGDAPE